MSSGSTAATPRVPWWRRILFWVLAAAVLGLAAAVGLFGSAYAAIDVPEPDDFALAETTTVYYADDATPMGSFSEYNRTSVPLETLPEHAYQAVIASEDRRFYENPGVDLRGIARALWNNLQGGATQGGSTLTQQYVERYYTGTTTSYLGKLREAILALKIDSQQSKDEILENYLNTIYFGRSAYGIEQASQAYFGHPASELTLSESALLAGIIPAPSAWDPAVDPEQAQQRFDRVLALMVEDGWITQAEADAAEFPETVDPQRNDTYAGPTGFLLDMVRTELVAAGLSGDDIDTGGYRITTTIDQRSQDAAVQAVANLPEDRPENNEVALVSLRPESGALVAVYGGEDFLEDSRNNATQDNAQAGSTAKPFVLVGAIEDGVSLEERFPSYSPMEIEGYDFEVSNYDDVDRGQITLVEATADSVNTTYALVNQEIGPERMVDVATRAGWPKDTPGLEPYASNVLGPASPHPIDTARAYNTFAAQGVRHEPYIVTQVLDRDGNVVYTGGAEGERVIDEAVMNEATYAMQAVTSPGGTGSTAGEIGRPTAGKTGSSNEYRSAWFAGWVPQLTTVVAMYQPGPNGEEEPLSSFGGVRLIAGGTFPAQIWRDYMAVATEGMEVLDLPERPDPEALPGEVERTTAPPSTQAPTAPPPTTRAPSTVEPTTEEPPPPAEPAPTEPPAPPPPPEPAPTAPPPPPEPAPTEPAPPVEPPPSEPAPPVEPPAPTTPAPPVEPAPPGGGGEPEPPGQVPAPPGQAPAPPGRVPGPPGQAPAPPGQAAAPPGSGEDWRRWLTP